MDVNVDDVSLSASRGFGCSHKIYFRIYICVYIYLHIYMHVRRPQVRRETYCFELFHIERCCDCEIKPETVSQLFFFWKQISGASLQIKKGASFRVPSLADQTNRSILKSVYNFFSYFNTFDFMNIFVFFIASFLNIYKKKIIKNDRYCWEVESVFNTLPSPGQTPPRGVLRTRISSTSFTFH